MLGSRMHLIGVFFTHWLGKLFINALDQCFSKDGSRHTFESHAFTFQSPNLCSQTWVNENLRISTTCLQRPQFWSPHLNLYNRHFTLSNDPQSTTTTNFGSRGLSLYTGLKLIALKYKKGHQIVFHSILWVVNYKC